MNIEDLIKQLKNVKKEKGNVDVVISTLGVISGQLTFIVEDLQPQWIQYSDNFPFSVTTKTSGLVIGFLPYEEEKK